MKIEIFFTYFLQDENFTIRDHISLMKNAQVQI